MLLLVDHIISLAAFIALIVILQRSDLWDRVRFSLSGWRERLLRFAFTMMAAAFFWKSVMLDVVRTADLVIDGAVLASLIAWLFQNRKSLKKYYPKVATKDIKGEYLSHKA